MTEASPSQVFFNIQTIHMKPHSTRYSPTYFKDIYNALKPAGHRGKKQTPPSQKLKYPDESSLRLPAGGLEPKKNQVDESMTTSRAAADCAASSHDSEHKPDERQLKTLSNDVRKAKRQMATAPNRKSKESQTAQAHLTQIFHTGNSEIAVLKEHLGRIRYLQLDIEAAHEKIAVLKSQLDELPRSHLKVKANPKATPLHEQRDLKAEKLAGLYEDIQKEHQAFMLEVERFKNKLAAHAGTHGSDPSISPTLGRFDADSGALVREYEAVCNAAFETAKSAAGFAPHTRLSRLVESASDTPDKPGTRSVFPKKTLTPATTPRPETPEGNLSESLVEDNATDMAKDLNTLMGIDSQTAKTCLARMNHIVQAMAPHAQQLRHIEAHIQTWLQSNPDGVRSDAEAHYATNKVESERAIQKGRQLLRQLHRELLAIVSRGTELFQHNEVRKDIGNARQHAGTHHAHLNEVLTQANDLMAQADR